MHPLEGVHEFSSVATVIGDSTRRNDVSTRDARAGELWYSAVCLPLNIFRRHGLELPAGENQGWSTEVRNIDAQGDAPQTRSFALLPQTPPKYQQRGVCARVLPSAV